MRCDDQNNEQDKLVAYVVLFKPIPRMQTGYPFRKQKGGIRIENFHKRQVIRTN